MSYELVADGYVRSSGTTTVSANLPTAPIQEELTVIDHITATTVPGATGTGTIVVSGGGQTIVQKTYTISVPDYIDIDWPNGYPIWETSGDDGKAFGPAIDLYEPQLSTATGEYKILGGVAGTGQTSQDIGQSFTVTAASHLGAGIWVFLKRTGNPLDTLTLTLDNVDITGSSIIATSAPVPAGQIPQSGAWVRFVFSSQVSIVNTTKYYFRLIRSGARDTANYISAPATVNSGLANGGAYTDDNQTWSAESGTDDILFRTFGGVRVQATFPAGSTSSSLLVTYHFEKPSRVRS